MAIGGRAIQNIGLKVAFEVNLDVGKIRARIEPQKCSSLLEICREGSRPAREELLDRILGGRIGHAVQGEGLGDFITTIDAKVILEISADSGHGMPYVDAPVTQMIGGADSREHEKLRTVDGATTQDDFAVGMKLSCYDAVEVFDGLCTVALDDDARCQGIGNNAEVATVEHTIEKSAIGAASAVNVGRHLKEAAPFLLPAIHLVVR